MSAQDGRTRRQRPVTPTRSPRGSSGSSSAADGDGGRSSGGGRGVAGEKRSATRLLGTEHCAYTVSYEQIPVADGAVQTARSRIARKLAALLRS